MARELSEDAKRVLEESRGAEPLVRTPGGGLVPASQMSAAIAYEQAHGIERPRAIGHITSVEESENGIRIGGVLTEVSLVRFPMMERRRFVLRDRFNEEGRVTRGADLGDVWNAMVKWFAEEAATRAMLASLGVSMEDDDV